MRLVDLLAAAQQQQPSSQWYQQSATPPYQNNQCGMNGIIYHDAPIGHAPVPTATYNCRAGFACYTPPTIPQTPSTNSRNSVADPSPKSIRTPKKKERANNMLSPKSASDNRRKSHRRQNSTPSSAAPYQAPPLPAALKRVNSKKATPTHRRGLSLDHANFRQPTILTPTLGSISQDDATVSITNSQQHFSSRSSTNWSSRARISTRNSTN